MHFFQKLIKQIQSLPSNCCCVVSEATYWFIIDYLTLFNIAFLKI